VLDRQGVKGVWFRLAEANELRVAVRLIPELNLQIQKCSELDKKHGDEVEALRGALTLRQLSNDELKVEVEKAVKAALEAQDEAAAAREELGRWWRSPIVWLTVGALAGALAGIAIAH
jgi:citrate lyase gamma subunit